jgi:hypothetical protein
MPLSRQFDPDVATVSRFDWLALPHNVEVFPQEAVVRESF